MASSPAPNNEALPRYSMVEGLNVHLDLGSGLSILWGLADPSDRDGWTSSRVDAAEALLPHVRQFVRVRQTLVDALVLVDDPVTRLRFDAARVRSGDVTAELFDLVTLACLQLNPQTDHQVRGSGPGGESSVGIFSRRLLHAACAMPATVHGAKRCSALANTASPSNTSGAPLQTQAEGHSPTIATPHNVARTGLNNVNPVANGGDNRSAATA